MDVLWTIFCYLVLIGSIFSKRMTVLKSKSLWIYRIIGICIIIVATFFTNTQGPTYLFFIGIGINLLKVKLLNLSNATEEQIKDSLDYEEKDNDSICEKTESGTKKIKEKFIFVKKHYKLLIIILCIILGFITILNDSDKEDSQKEYKQNISETKADKKETSILTVDDIYLDPSKYEGKNVTVKGKILNGTVPVNDDIGDLKPPLYGTDDKYIILDGEFPSQQNVDNVLVTGKISKQGKELIIKVENYNFDNAVEIETTQNSVSNTTFGKMREAASSYAYLNWNQFLRNPTSLAGTFIYIPGEVIDINYSDGITHGLIDTQGNGNIDDMVSFIISGEVYDINVGDIIAPMGVISTETGIATNSVTDEIVNTPLIEVSDPNLWKINYELDLSDKEIQDFMYGTYKAIDANDIDEYIGEEFNFNADSLGGNKYTYKETVYINPSIAITSGNLMRGYDDIRISMNLIVDGMGVGDPYGNSKLQVTSVSIDLKDGTMLFDADGGYGSKYRKID